MYEPTLILNLTFEGQYQFSLRSWYFGFESTMKKFEDWATQTVQVKTKEWPRIVWFWWKLTFIRVPKITWKFSDLKMHFRTIRTKPKTSKNTNIIVLGQKLRSRQVPGVLVLVLFSKNWAIWRNLVFDPFRVTYIKNLTIFFICY